MSLYVYENGRNSDNVDIWEAMLRIAYPDTDLVVAGHHIFHRRAGHSQHEEIPSADWLIFDHYIAMKVWGDGYQAVLGRLAMEPGRTRDKLLRDLFNARMPA
jgi:hypothetical protein